MIDRLNVELEVSRDYEGRCWEIYTTSQNALNSAVQDLQRRRQFYSLETTRRAEEVSFLNDVTRVFKAKVGKLSEYLDQLWIEENNWDAVTKKWNLVIKYYMKYI